MLSLVKTIDSVSKICVELVKNDLKSKIMHVLRSENSSIEPEELAIQPILRFGPSASQHFLHEKIFERPLDFNKICRVLKKNYTLKRLSGSRVMTFGDAMRSEELISARKFAESVRFADAYE